MSSQQRRWTKSNEAKKRKDSRSSNPSDLGSESLDVVLLLLESRVGDEHGEVGVLDSELLDLLVEPS